MIATMSHVTTEQINQPSLRAQWEARALRRIEIDPTLPRGHESIIARNEQITTAYSEMYLRNPQVYLWAGMAALTSAEVGRGMYQMKLLRLSRMGWLIGLLNRDLDIIFEALGQGNMAVFEDIYWQHMAYELAGLAELERIYAAGDLAQSAIEGWRLIEHGRRTGDESLIWQGNLQLLYFEQREVLQPAVYESRPSLWQQLSNWIESPLLGHYETFGAYAPAHNIGIFEQRWHWISTSLVPRWQRLVQEQPERVERSLQRRMLGGAPFPLIDKLLMRRAERALASV
jgi:hypothetical protein